MNPPTPCPDPARLRVLLAGARSDPDLGGLEAHLDTCKRCQQTLDELVADQGSWADVARHLGGARAELDAGDAYGDESDDTQTQAEPGADLPLDFLAPSSRSDAIGRLGHYEILEVVGRGGMGVVLRAFDERLHRVVAIKVMSPHLAATATARKRFTREARAAAAVTHDHIVTIHAVDEANGLPYLAMQYVSGQSLQARLDRTGPLQMTEVVRIGMQAAQGLAAAHKHGLVHRDIKPANILLENGVERVKITDFGLARIADDASLTHSGVVAGTPQYMSPEQAAGLPVDDRSDLFSLGSVLYAMCTGRPPFRARATVAVLKRVCDAAPSPVREANPEVPAWLAEVITRLHAKDPADRYQTAAEVAELLGRHLAHAQHPSAAPPPPSPARRGAGGEGRVARPRHRWAVAAAVGLALFAALGTTEATGVTNVRATVIRILRPEGTLVVETDDPGVKVTVEGDGGLIITGAGLEEIRLRPGSYRVVADRDGQRVPLDRELVAVSRGGREIVRVKLEPPPPFPEPGAFVLLAAGKERKFETLAEAVSAADGGDVIEVRGDGPFETDGVKVGGGALVIRAAPGRRPVISLSAKGRDENRSMFVGHSATLTLEGLTLQLIGRSRTVEGEATSLVFTESSHLRVANCRFVAKDNAAVALWGSPGSSIDVRNCAIVGPNHAVIFDQTPKEGTLSVDNCLLATSEGVQVAFDRPDRLHQTDVRLTRNTFVGNIAVLFAIRFAPDFFPAGPKPKVSPFRVKAEDNIFAVTESTIHAPQLPEVEAWREKPVPAEKVKTLVSDLMEWRDRRSLYPSTVPFMTSQWLRPTGWGPFEPLVGSDRPEAWRQFAGPEAAALRGEPRFAGGNVLVQAQPEATPERLLPRHFRLLPQSPGSRAGPGGTDVGADVDLVGPGEAYERWKKTPGYQQWLAETGQTKK